MLCPIFYLTTSIDRRNEAVYKGAWLPPELIYLLPHISGSELKILAAILYNYMQTGGGEPTTLTEIEHLTGLSRPTVDATLDRLLAGQLMERQAREALLSRFRSLMKHTLTGQEYRLRLPTNRFEIDGRADRIRE
jgi:DNA-binding MarR family transcriptional regulator